MIPYGKQSIDQSDIDSVISVLKSDWLTQGPMIANFEKALCEYTGAKYAVAVCNATAALHIACLAAGLKKGDSLWTSVNTFVASANCGLYCGADVDLVDIENKTYNLDLDLLEKKLRSGGKIPKIIIPVHFAGQSVDMKRLHALKKEFGFTLIEDASHAIGGSYQGEKIGNGRYSDMTVFSFHPVKIVTTGEGGAILTNDEKLYQSLMMLRTHGITKDEKLLSEPTHGSWYYEQQALGFNYRITDIHAALGFSQLKKIDRFIERRHEIAKRYDRELAGLPLTTPWQSADSKSAYHLYVIRIDTAKVKKSHRQVFEELRENGIGVQLHYIPVHLQPYYQGLGFKKGAYPVAEKYYGETISIPMYAGLSESEQTKVIETLKKILK